MVPALPLDRKQPGLGDCDHSKGLHHDLRQRTAGAFTLTPEIGLAGPSVKRSGGGGQIWAKLQILQQEGNHHDSAHSLYRDGEGP